MDINPRTQRAIPCSRRGWQWTFIRARCAPFETGGEIRKLRQPVAPLASRGPRPGHERGRTPRTGSIVGGSVFTGVPRCRNPLETAFSTARVSPSPVSCLNPLCHEDNDAREISDAPNCAPPRCAFPSPPPTCAHCTGAPTLAPPRPSAHPRPIEPAPYPLFAIHRHSGSASTVRPSLSTSAIGETKL